MKEEKRSNEWDKIERIRSHFKSPIFNIMLLIIVGLFVFGATFAYVHFFVPPAYAGELIQSTTYKNLDKLIQSGDYKQFKIDYYENFIDCNGWVSSGSACRQIMTATYQNQLILDGMK